MAKNTMVQMTSPKGIANYPYLNEADTKFVADGEYKVNLALEDNEVTQKFLSKLEATRDNLLADFAPLKEAKAKGKRVNLADLYDEDGEGNIILKLKQKAIIRTKDGKSFEKKVALFDRHGKPMTDLIGYGSTIKACFGVCPYYTPSTKLAGVSLRLVAVQVIDLKSGNNEDASSYGFGEEEGTYEATGSEAEAMGFDEDDDDYDEASNF